MRMIYTTRYALAGLAFCLFISSPAAAQQQAALPQVEQQQAPPPQAPPGFQLNQLQQAFLNQVLDAWQLESGKIVTFKCSFQRWEYDVAFGPKDKNIPLNKN